MFINVNFIISLNISLLLLHNFTFLKNYFYVHILLPASCFESQKVHWPWFNSDEQLFSCLQQHRNNDGNKGLLRKKWIIRGPQYENIYSILTSKKYVNMNRFSWIFHFPVYALNLLKNCALHLLKIDACFKFYVLILNSKFDEKLVN